MEIKIIRPSRLCPLPIPKRSCSAIGAVAARGRLETPHGRCCMQDATMQEIQDRMMTSLQAMDAEALFRTWLPAQIQGFEQMQKFFWSQFANGDTGQGSGRE